LYISIRIAGTCKPERTAFGFKAQGIAAAKQSINAKKKCNDMLRNMGPEGKGMLGLLRKPMVSVCTYLYTGKNRHEIKNKQIQSLNFKGEPVAEA
jgi:hypothetical protein